VRIISWNVNGLRSVLRKGFLDWVKKESPDILCLQEIKIQESEIPFDLIYLDGYNACFNTSERKGYSGVVVYSKVKPSYMKKKLNLGEFDREGRLLEIKFPEFILMNIYIPHGARDKSKISYKMEVFRKLQEDLDRRMANGENIILAGDFNIAHEEIDLARPKGNINNTMFTFPERMQIERILKLGFVDSFREFHKEGENYSWWPYYQNARERNLGWRIDYIFISGSLKAKLMNSFILTDVNGSDHCPVGIDLNID
jgi:exodeoxyribonuclease III